MPANLSLSQKRVISRLAWILCSLGQLDKVYLDFNEPEQRPLDLVTLEEARRYYAEGHFAAGSMGPKVESIISFLESGGRRAVVTTPANVLEALRGRTGTHFTP